MVPQSLKRKIIMLLAGFLLAQTGCKRRGDDAPPPPELPSVTVELPKWGTLKRTIHQPGFTKPYEQTPIYARVQGKVAEVNVDRGYFVKKGKPLARLFVPELEQAWKAKSARAKQADAQVQQAYEGLQAAGANVKTFEALILETEAAVAEAEAKQMRWDSEYKRTYKLFTEGTFQKQQVDENFYQWKAATAGLAQARYRKQFAEASVNESKAKQKKAAADLETANEFVKVAEAERDEAKVWYDFRYIDAPYDGIVTVRNAHPGQFFQVSSSGTNNKSAEPMFQFVNMDPLRVVVQVPEYDAPLVKTDKDSTTVKSYGSTAYITFQGLSDKVIPGTVTLSADALDNQARTLTVEIHLPNPPDKDGKHKLLPGMYVNAAIEVETAKTWILPLQAVYTDGDKSYCFVVEPSADQKGKAIKTVVKIGVANDIDVEVLQKRTGNSSDREGWANITGEELIVAGNPESLLDGQAVRFVPAK